MTNFPFGFGRGDADPPDPNDPAQQFGMPSGMPGQFNLFGELQKLLNWSGGPVNWDLAKQLAAQTLGNCL